MRIDLYNLYLLQWRFRKIYVHHTLSYMPKPDRNRGNVLKVHTRVPGLLYRVVHYEVPGCICRMYPGTSKPAGALRILPVRGSTITYTGTHDISRMCCGTSNQRVMLPAYMYYMQVYTHIYLHVRHLRILPVILLVHTLVRMTYMQVYYTHIKLHVRHLRILLLRLLVHTLVRMTYLACNPGLQTGESCYLHTCILCTYIHM